MCVIDWEVFWNAVSAVANWILVLIAAITARFAFSQSRVAEDTRQTQVLLQANADIQSYRNHPSVRVIRRRLVELLETHPVAGERLQTLLVSNEIEAYWEFMARTNNLCWMILAVPGEMRNHLLSTIGRNLVLEWKSLLPLIEHRREMRGDGNWYMQQFSQVVAMIEEKWPEPLSKTL